MARGSAKYAWKQYSVGAVVPAAIFSRELALAPTFEASSLPAFPLRVLRGSLFFPLGFNLYLLLFALGNFLAHAGNGLAIVRRAENRRAGHESIRAGGGNFADIVGFHAAVNFQPDIPAG